MQNIGQKGIKMGPKDEKLKEILATTQSIVMECDFLHMKRPESENIIKRQMKKLGELLEGEEYEVPVKMLSKIIEAPNKVDKNTPLIQDIVEVVSASANHKINEDDYHV